MRHMVRMLFSLVLLVAAASAQTAPAAPATTPAGPGSAVNSWLPPLTGSEDATVKKARNFLTQMIEALGGNAYMELQTIEQSGLAYSFYNNKPNNIGTEFHRLVKFPDKERNELTKQR